MPLRLYGLLPDGRIAAVDPHEDGARDTLLAIDWKTGAQTPLHKTEGSDVTPIADPWSHQILGVRWTEDLPKPALLRRTAPAGLFDSADPIQRRICDIGVVVARSLGFLVFGEHADDAGAYYLYDRAPDKLRAIGKTYPALEGMPALGNRRPSSFARATANSVPAYLTLPRGSNPRRCRWCCSCMVDRTRATRSRSTGGRASSPRADTRCCRSTSRLDRIWI
jgi:hypothetical protein